MKNYQIFEEKYNKQEYQFLYVGDNLKKDFVTPNKLGWHTICLKDTQGLIVHSQDVLVADEFSPKYVIEKFSELIVVIETINKNSN